STPDVDDHVSRGFLNRQAGTDRRGHRLFDYVGGFAGTGELRRLFHRTLFDTGDARGDADDHAGLDPSALMHFVDEVAQHLLAHVEIGDDPVFEGADRLDVRGCAPDHSFGFESDGQWTTIFDVYCNDRRLA